MQDIKNQHYLGQIDKREFINRMQEYHRILFRYAEELGHVGISHIDISAGEVVFTSRKNRVRMVVNIEDKRIIPLEIFNFGTYEEAELDMILALIGDSGTFFDIGANIGWYSLNVDKAKEKWKIVAFEPICNTFTQLNYNVKLNGSCAKVFNCGLSDQNKSIPFYYSPEWSGNASSQDLGVDIPKKIEHCKVRKMDEFVKTHKYRVDFIKCDVEGAELNVFKGGEKTIARDLPMVFTEILRKWTAKFGYHYNGILSFFFDLGYNCYIIEAGKLVQIDWITEQTENTNFIFLHKEKHLGLERVKGLINE